VIFQAEQDYRIIALVTKFLARLLANDDRQQARLYRKLSETQKGILDYIILNVFAKEALVRLSCVEALEQIVTYEEGAEW